ncbi:MAG: hypothetical protein ACI4XM_06165 [Candidatus Coprovivens sp.]
MEQYIEEMINYYRDLGFSEEKLNRLRKLIEEEFKTIEITVANPKGIWPIIDEETKEQLGIPDNDFNYHIIPGNKSRREEVALTQEFLIDLPNQVPHIIHPVNDIEFINYGDTELVYVVTSLLSRNTILVGQPITPLGIVKLEYENLRHLATKNPSLVVAPKAYISNGQREAYITPYIHQARCIATYGNKYGAYIPEPYYRFESYQDDDEYLITKTIIANLVRLYDEENKLALAECKIGGGDFIMEQSFDNVPHTTENALKHMKLIASRKLINIEMRDYLRLLKEEFQKRTYYRTITERDPNIIVNQKNRVPMTEEAINDGIKLGLSLRKK